MKCQRCHVDNPESNLFCGGCGAELIAEVVEDIEVVETPSDRFRYRWKIALGVCISIILTVVLIISISNGIAQSELNAQRKQAAREQAEKNAMLSARKETREEKILTDRLISNGQVVIGMTRAQAMSAWGTPKDINTTTTRYGTTEQWVYSSGKYLYFDNGVLTSIQK